MKESRGNTGEREPKSSKSSDNGAIFLFIVANPLLPASLLSLGD
jgi:hypothetical protein